MDAKTVAEHQRQQTQLYGRPLGQIVDHLTATLGLNRARLAQTLGLSAPMLSQLASGQRVKIGNPQVLARLQALLELAARAGQMSPADIDAALAQIAQRTTTITATAPAGDDVLRALATVGNPVALLAAAEAAAPHSPALAHLLRAAADASHG